MYNRSSMDWSYPDPEAEWHFDIRKMSAISHILEEKQGSNAAQNSMIAQFFIERFVQFRSARFKGSLHVRPGTLWTYVLTPSRRTCKHPLDVRPHPLTPYVQWIYYRKIWCFVPFGCHFFTLWEARIFSGGQPRLILSHSQDVSECQNESKMRKSVAGWHEKGVLIWQGSLTSVL